MTKKKSTENNFIDNNFPEYSEFNNKNENEIIELIHNTIKSDYIDKGRKPDLLTMLLLILINKK